MELSNNLHLIKNLFQALENIDSLYTDPDSTFREILGHDLKNLGNELDKDISDTMNLLRDKLRTKLLKKLKTFDVSIVRNIEI
jgi:hypothetical protein